MIYETKKVLAVAALIVAAGIGSIEMTRNPAEAMTSEGSVDYARFRVEGAFAAAAEVPPIEFELGLAEKGDKLPVGCEGPFLAEVQAECMDVAYEVSDEIGTVVETRLGAATSVLMRLDEFDLAAN